MGPSMKYADYVSLGGRYLRSVNLATDSKSSAGVQGYVVSGNARDLAIRVLRELGPGGSGRTWSILGPYGSGKSSFATWLSMLLSPQSSALHAAALEPFRLAWPEFVPELDKALAAAGPGLACAVATGERAALSLLVMRAVALELAKHLPADSDVLLRARLYANALENAESIADSVIADCTIAAARALVAVGLSGLAVIVDEMGKVLEWALQDPSHSDLYLLQVLAEAASRCHDAKLVLMTVVHQGFQAYGEGERKVVRDELTKVEGRFEVVPFIESLSHLTTLISQALIQQTSPAKLPGYAHAQASAAELVRHYGTKELPDQSTLLACFPLNPVTAVCLGPIFRLKFGQNERSLFAFLGSLEPFGFKSFLATTPATSTQLFHLGDLYDYLVANTGVRFQLDRADRVWPGVETALARLEPHDGPVTAAVLKAIGVLTAVGRASRVRADRLTLQIGLGISKADLDRALSALEKRSIITYRDFRGAYQIWDGSDLDIPAELERVRSEVMQRGDFASFLQKAFAPMPLVASRHGHISGTMRYLNTRYVSAREVTKSKCSPSADGADGELLFIVPEDQAELGKAKEAALTYGRGDKDLPVVYALPRQAERLLDAVVDYLTIVEVEQVAPGLDSDPTARRDLAERRLGAQDALATALQHAFGEWADGAGATWIYNKSEHIVTERQSAAASAIFDEVFKSAPAIRNELVNRAVLSTVAAKARRQLLELLLNEESRHKPALGISGHPPELSIYRSVLGATSLHQEREVGRLYLDRNPKSKQLSTLWKRIDDTLDRGKDGRRDLESLLKLMRAPPFGIRDGVGMILLLVYYLTGEDELFLYEEQALVPRIGADFPHRMLRRPESFEFQRVPKDSKALVIAGLLWDNIAKKARPESGMTLRIVRILMRMITDLSPFAQSTQRLSEPARRVRSCIKGAKDPVKLLAEDLRAAVRDGADSSMPDDSEVAGRVYAAIAELQASDTRLIRQVANIVGQQFGVGGEPEVVFSALGQRAKLVSELKELTPQLRRFSTMSAEIYGTGAGDWQDWAASVATFIDGKQAADWTDDALTNFAFACHTLARQFKAAEGIALAANNGTAPSSGARLYRLSVYDRLGTEHAVVASESPQNAKALAEIGNAVRGVANSAGLSDDEVLSALAQFLVERVEQRSSKVNT